jgi:hypothetical protein
MCILKTKEARLIQILLLNIYSYFSFSIKGNVRVAHMRCEEDSEDCKESILIGGIYLLKSNQFY